MKRTPPLQSPRAEMARHLPASKSSNLGAYFDSYRPPQIQSECEEWRAAQQTIRRRDYACAAKCASCLRVSERWRADTSTTKFKHTSIACGNGQAYSVGGPNQPEGPSKLKCAGES